jgi:hypothetical protein
MMATTTIMTTMMSTDGFMLGPLGLPERERERECATRTNSIPPNDWGEGNVERARREEEEEEEGGGRRLRARTFSMALVNLLVEV